MLRLARTSGWGRGELRAMRPPEFEEYLKAAAAGEAEDGPRDMIQQLLALKKGR